MGLRPGVPATDFLDRMAASAFDISGSTGAKPPSDLLDPLVWPAPPHHLLGLFHRRQVGSQRLGIDILPSTGSTAVELAEMGVKLTAKKTNIFGDLSLAPLVLNDVTVCWILNMVAYEAGLATSRSADNFAVGTRQDDNFFVSSYVSFFAKLVKRGEDVQELRAIGHHQQRYDRWSDTRLLQLAGELYFHISERIQQYKQKRWIWIRIHRFFYRNMKTILAVVTVVGALAGILKLIPSRRSWARPWVCNIRLPNVCYIY
jgi:hypothetical protein